MTQGTRILAADVQVGIIRFNSTLVVFTRSFTPLITTITQPTVVFVGENSVI
jgi:hypothetical protein